MTNSNVITLPVSGVTIKIRRQSMDILQAIQTRAMQMHQKPTPPIVKEEVGPDTFIDRENTSAPEYIHALQEYEQKFTISMAEMLLKIIVSTCIFKDENLQSIIDDSKEMQQLYLSLGLDVPTNIDEFAFKYVIAVSQEDMGTLIYEVFGKTLPTEAQVAMRKMMFPGTV